MDASRVLKRIVFGSAMIVAITGLLLLDYWLGHDANASRTSIGLRGLPVAAVLVALAAIGLLEFAGLFQRVGIAIHRKTALLGVVVLTAGPLLREVILLGPTWLARLSGAVLDWPALPALLVLAAFVAQIRTKSLDNALPRIAATVLGMFYLGLGGGLILQLRMISLPLLVLFLLAVKFMDIGAYFTGTAIGRHKMIPWLSPAKSWEGLVGGMVFAAGATVGGLALLAAILGESFPAESCGLWILWGVLTGLASQLGDLCESLIKRAADAKDSGAVVPQFGGVLDMLDSPLLAAPAAMVLLRWLGLG
jgi:phosphatidate cytidylyltransferase